MKTVLFALLIFVVSSNLFAQKAEKQVSFAVENKPHSYYVEQAELWWKKLEKDKTSEENWFNYFRACRNAQGTVNWRMDFAKESPYLKDGQDIVDLMEKHIPNTFMFNYLSYLNRGIGTIHGDRIMKAYKMNPDFEGIQASVVSYAVSTVDNKLRAEANKDWYNRNYWSPEYFQYAYNVLSSVEENAILFTQNDVDSYPVWMLQDVLGIRKDVLVLNVDYMLIDSHREHYMKVLNVKPMEIPDSIKKLDVYEQNWRNIMKHILRNYKFERPLYLGLTIYPHMYEGFEDRLEISGLTQKFCKSKENLALLNEELLNDTFMMDEVRNPILFDKNQQSINFNNMAYVNMLKVLYDHYTSTKQLDKANEMKILSLNIVNRTGSKENIEAITKLFSS